MIDYLATPAVAAYFDARECEAYYQAFKLAKVRRDFHDRLTEVLEQFIALTDSPAGSAVVDYVIGESLRAQRQGKAAALGSVLAVARDRCPEGIELLGLSEPLTFDSLKSAYRRAARENHPDVGGTHEAMIAVNEAFDFAHKLLCDRQVDAGVEVGVVTSPREITDCASYRYKCGELLFLIALDEWNLDGAFAWLELITSVPWQQSPYASHPWRRIALTESASKLATRLSLTPLREQATRALAVARRGLEEANKTRLNYGPFVRLAEDVLDGKRQTQVAISSRRQADNALRLGVIGQKRYIRIMERVATLEAFEERCEDGLRRLQTAGGFLIDLPTDRIARGKVPRGHLIPEPGYFTTGIEGLTDDQQAECLVAFGDRATLALVRKYTFVRLVSLFESVLFYPGQVDDAAAEAEAQTLASLQDGSLRRYATEVAQAVAQVRRQPPPERETRAGLLLRLRQPSEHTKGGLRVTMSLGSTSPLGMPLAPDYFMVVLLPLDDLRELARTGRLPESEEARLDREAWKRDLDTLRTPRARVAHDAAWAAMDVAKADPEGAVREFREYCDFLLSLGKSMVHVQELQLGWWVDRLTSTLVRLKRWGEALEWLERYFALPPRYRARSSSSEEEKLRKRLRRCAAALGQPSEAQKKD